MKSFYNILQVLIYNHRNVACVFNIDIILGYLEQGLLVRDAKKLRQHYFGTSHWRLDLISMIPTDVAYFWWGPNECNYDQVPCAVIVRINRLLRLPRMWEWFERTETATGYPNAFRICKVSRSLNVISSPKNLYHKCSCRLTFTQ